MKLALYLPNFRDKVTVSEIVDLARLAEELEFDSIWTLDRIKDAGLTMPLLWPPFKGVPTAKTIVDLRRLKEDILPKVE